MKDIVVVALLVVAFATLVTTHVAIAYGLAFRPPRWRAAAGFFLPPLGAWFAWKERMKVRLGLFLGAVVLYAVARVLASA